MEDLRIIFMGTPEFAVPSIEILIEHQFNVVAVITAPDKPQGRGQKLVPSAIKTAAIKYNLPVLQPVNLKAPEFHQELRDYRADLQVVVAFRMLPEAVWSMPRLGTFNLHASLLPQYRGAAPINWAIINGETETGVTTFLLKHEIDTGSILFQEKEAIGESDDAGSLYERLMKRGADLVLKTVRAINTGDYKPMPQKENNGVRHAPKIFRETCEINWNSSSTKVRDFVRGLSPYPAAWTMIHGKVYKLLRVSVISHLTANANRQITDGDIDTDNKTYLYFATTDGLVSVDELQPEGKRKMSIQDFFRGNKL